MATKIQFRRDTAINWINANPVLMEGEVGYELDSDQYKLGDGVKSWKDLPYRGYPCLQQMGESTTTPMSQKATTDELDSINDKLNTIAMGVNVTLSLGPSCIYKDVATSISITASVTGIIPETLSIREDSVLGALISSENNVATLTTSKKYTITSNSKVLYGIATYKGLQFSASAIINARHPIYYGFGNSVSEIIVDDNRMSARTSASGIYTAKSTDDGQHFYIIIPPDIHSLNNFTMGGAPYVMNSSTKTINGIDYLVYTSGAVYNKGVTVSVIAS